MTGPADLVWQAERVRTSLWTAVVISLAHEAASGTSKDDLVVLRQRAIARFNCYPDALWWIRRRAAFTDPSSLVHPNQDHLLPPPKIQDPRRDPLLFAPLPALPALPASLDKGRRSLP